jgi:hypothetical protein
MTVYVSPPNWSDFIDNLLPAADHLEDRDVGDPDARRWLEAAVLLRAAHDTLLAPNDVRAWDEIVNAIGWLIGYGQRHGDKLPPDTVTFICAVADAREQCGAPRERDEVVEELCRATDGCLLPKEV